MKFAHTLPRVALAILFWLVTRPAFAHIGSGLGGGFFSGFSHPLLGPDHLLAMVSVGIWGAELGAPAIWVLPIAFPLIMAFGGAAGIIGVPLPGTEIIIALSVIVLGDMVATATWSIWYWRWSSSASLLFHTVITGPRRMAAWRGLTGID
jgi:urease accessory protein